jgi:hypothetical protein
MNSVKALYGKFILLISAVILSMAWWSTAYAGTVRGILHVSPVTGETSISLSGLPRPLRLVPVNPAVNLELMKLHEGDFLVGTANYHPPSSSLVLDAIESVGLQNLLGRWMTDNQQVFEFQDFFRLNLYDLRTDFFDVGSKKVSLSNKREYKYLLSPERDSGRFSIFLSDEKDIMIGSLQFTTGRVLISVFDPKTGAVANTISLAPLVLPEATISSAFQ